MSVDRRHRDGACEGRGSGPRSRERRWLWFVGVVFASSGVSCVQTGSVPQQLPEVAVPLELSPSEPSEAPSPTLGAAGAPSEGAETEEVESSPAAGPKKPLTFAPDPTPLQSREQYELTFRYDRGSVALVGVEEKVFPQPVTSPRRVGRYAVELWIGKELVDRVRFDFPLLGAPADDSTLSEGLATSHKVLVPASKRATRATLVDRATGEQVNLPWPPRGPSGTELGEPEPPAPNVVPVERSEAPPSTGGQSSTSRGAPPHAAPAPAR